MGKFLEVVAKTDDVYTNVWTSMSGKVMYTAGSVPIDCGHVTLCLSLTSVIVVFILALIASFTPGPDGPMPGMYAYCVMCSYSVTCRPGDSPSESVQNPKFLFNIKTWETGWFASPAVVDLDGDGSKEIVLAQYSLFVYNSTGTQLSRATGTGRIYSPHVIADVDNDGNLDECHSVYNVIML